VAEDHVACTLCARPDDGKHGWMVVTVGPLGPRRCDAATPHTFVVCPTCARTISMRLAFHGIPLGEA
jgi:hypothetical protein